MSTRRHPSTRKKTSRTGVDSVQDEGIQNSIHPKADVDQPRTKSLYETWIYRFTPMCLLRSRFTSTAVIKPSATTAVPDAAANSHYV